MGKFLDTSYKDTVNKLTEIKNDLLNNPYYLYTDKKACSTTYYHINDEKSMLDEASRINYADLGDNCPLRYNKIEDFFIYGIEKVNLNLDNTDFGLESNPIEGESVILPGTITPYPNDYFEIDHITDGPWLFRVNEVQKDTLDDGSNIYKINYKLEHTSNKDILPLIVDNYKLVTNNIGTKYNTVIKSDKYDLGVSIENIATSLKEYYKDLFYNSRVQTFTFRWLDGDRFYDDFMIEFLIRNKIMDTGSSFDYLHIDHKIQLPRTFSMDYANTFFRSFETKDIKHLCKARTDSMAKYIDDFGSIFKTVPDNYFTLNYKVYNYSIPGETPYLVYNIISCFPKDLIEYIKENKLVTDNESIIYPLYNIIIKYFNNTDYTVEDFENLESMDYESENLKLFYLIPLCIFCLEEFIKGLIS